MRGVIVAFLLMWAGMAGAAERLILPVPVTTLYPGQIIGAEMLGERAFRPTMRGRAAMAADAGQLLGKVARRTLLPGQPVPLASVGEPELVKRGQPVAVIYREGGLEITAQGMALEGAAKGEPVRVRNMDSGITVNGLVAEDGSVLVGAIR